MAKAHLPDFGGCIANSLPRDARLAAGAPDGVCLPSTISAATAMPFRHLDPHPGESGPPNADAWWASLPVEGGEADAPFLLRSAVGDAFSNGGLLLHRYAVVDPQPYDWFLRNALRREADFVHCLLNHAGLAGYRDCLGINEAVEAEVLEDMSGTGMAASALAGILTDGGAYRRVPRGTAQAAATEFVRTFLGDARADVVGWDLRLPASLWHHGIAWDHTFLWVDRSSWGFTLLDITDLD